MRISIVISLITSLPCVPRWAVSEKNTASSSTGRQRTMRPQYYSRTYFTLIYQHIHVQTFPRTVFRHVQVNFRTNFAAKNAKYVGKVVSTTRPTDTNSICQLQLIWYKTTYKTTRPSYGTGAGMKAGSIYHVAIHPPPKRRSRTNKQAKAVPVPPMSFINVKHSVRQLTQHGTSAREHEHTKPN